MDEYVPRSLSPADARKQRAMIKRSRRLYSKHQFEPRSQLRSFQSSPSKHVEKAKKLYGVKALTPSSALAKATGCSKRALKQVIRKGEGAYYSSGSRPNQTAESWGRARLASAITGGRAALVDFEILKRGCDPPKPAFQLALERKAHEPRRRSKTR